MWKKTFRQKHTKTGKLSSHVMESTTESNNLKVFRIAVFSNINDHSIEYIRIVHKSIYLLKYLLNFFSKFSVQLGRQLGERGEGDHASPILKIRKKCPDFVKNALIVSIFELKFSIQNVVLRVSRKKLPNFSLRGPFSWCF